MKSVNVIATAILAFGAGQAIADCRFNAPITGAALSSLLSGSLVCGAPGAAYPGGALSSDRWQEEHLVGGQLWDYKLGNGDPVDPRKQVGTWSVSATQVTHSYTGGPSFVWDVRPVSGNIYSFCVGPNEHVNATIGPNTGAGCGGAFPTGAPVSATKSPQSTPKK